MADDLYAFRRCLDSQAMRRGPFYLTACGLTSAGAFVEQRLAQEHPDHEQNNRLK